MKMVDCPQCGKSCEYSSQNHFRPFCSHRCQLLDLGQWADEKYTIPSDEPPDVTEIENNTDHIDPHSD
ncbi:MAG: DNA gyrase inhibitor YacG [Bdellovibrionaceae bacterium]|nr:DNA gyrase inhibitor YacG [Bdellovibrionales bacterium]MCB9086483.1 DNA gyrase inhibitor YacG [Pseudobdellovibrionaceae bacterium]